MKHYIRTMAALAACLVLVFGIAQADKRVSNQGSIRVKQVSTSAVSVSQTSPATRTAIGIQRLSAIRSGEKQINWQVVSGGGLPCSSSGFCISGTVNQTAVGMTDSAGFQACHGYWQDFYVRGDANGSWAIDIDDVVFLINYIFTGGPPPDPLSSGDVNDSGGVDIDDVVYLINYIFSGGPKPTSAFDEGPRLSKSVVGTAELTTIKRTDGQRSSVTYLVESDHQVQAIQLEFQLRGKVRDVAVQSRVDGIQEFHGIRDGILRIGLLDLFGRVMIPEGKSEVVTVSYSGDGEIELNRSILVAIGGGRLQTTLTRDEPIALPREYTLNQNYPNPFNPTTIIGFSLPASSKVRLDVFNILGQRVSTLIDEQRPAGHHSVTWNGMNDSGEPVASGVYFYRIESEEFTSCKKMVLLK